MTVHYTWGEDRRSGTTLRDESGAWIGHVSSVQYRTLCGRWDVEDPSHEYPLDLHILCRRRPVGVCPVCWHELRRSALEVNGITAEQLAPRCRNWLIAHHRTIPREDVSP